MYLEETETRDREDITRIQSERLTSLLDRLSTVDSPFWKSKLSSVGSIGSIEDIDKGMMLGCGYPMGPFTLLDFVGIDTTYRIAEIMFDEYREKRYAPPPLLKRMMLAGMHGKKSGKGFYDYSTTPPSVTPLGI